MCSVDLAQLLRLMYEASIFTRSLFLFIHDGFRDKFHLKFADLSRVHVIFAFNPLQGYCTTDWFAVSDKTIINLSRKISIMSHFLLHFKSHSFQYYISLVALFHFILTFSAIFRLQCFIFHHLQPFILGTAVNRGVSEGVAISWNKSQSPLHCYDISPPSFYASFNHKPLLHQECYFVRKVQKYNILYTSHSVFTFLVGYLHYFSNLLFLYISAKLLHCLMVVCSPSLSP